MTFASSLPSLGLSFPEEVGQADHKLECSNTRAGCPGQAQGRGLTKARPQGRKLRFLVLFLSFPSPQEGLGSSDREAECTQRYSAFCGCPGGCGRYQGRLAMI